MGWLTVLILHNENVTGNAEGPKPDMRRAHWQLLESLLPVLKPVSICQLKLQQHHSMSISVGLLSSHLIAKDDDIPAVCKFKTNLCTEQLLTQHECYKLPTSYAR